MANQDALFGIHAAAMQFQSRRMELISSNIANADTPGFQARDLDFAKALEQAALSSQPSPASGGALAATQPGHMGADGVSASAVSSELPELVYRKPLQPSADGNTVDLHTEQAAFADAALHYKASMSFVEGRLRSLMTALTGQ